MREQDKGKRGSGCEMLGWRHEFVELKLGILLPGLTMTGGSLSLWPNPDPIGDISFGWAVFVLRNDATLGRLPNRFAAPLQWKLSIH